MSKKLIGILSVGLAIVGLLMTGCSTADTAKGAYVDGTYNGKAESHGGELLVTVIVKDGKIVVVTPVATDTAGISDAAIARMPDAIIKAQSPEVDAVAGASETSEAIKAAVKDALKNAGNTAEAAKARSKAKQDNSNAQPTRTVETDVVVIGGGNAGLAASVEASAAGAKVILLEKIPFLGGNSIRSGGAYNTADPERQKAQGIEDSPQKHYEQTLAGGDNKADPELVHILTFNALDGLHWLESLGMKWEPKVFTVLGALWPRSHSPVAATGTGFIKTLGAAAQKNGVTILLDTKALRLVQTKGRVSGVVATNLQTGETVQYNARNGVVLAAGGFGANKEMRQKYDPKILPSYGTTNSVGATGDGIVMAESVKAALVGMEYIQMLPLGDPKTGVLEGWVGFNVEDYIYVNKDGKRFVSEADRRDVMTQALIRQKDQYMFLICDAHSMPSPQSKNSFNETAEQLVKAGRAFTSDTVEGLAAQMKVDPATLKATIDEYNTGVETKSDKFGKKLLGNKIDKAPYYASPRIPTVHHTMGGVKINTKAQVIDVNGNPIPGLFAAGEVTGGIHGSNRLGGNALADTIVFGRIAGTNVVALK
jgi:fumarate reductase flavoprotein subunit